MNNQVTLQFSSEAPEWRSVSKGFLGLGFAIIQPVKLLEVR